jgi:hypothetical protein
MQSIELKVTGLKLAGLRFRLAALIFRFGALVAGAAVNIELHS